MSKPTPPYYFKDDSDTYHWETSCDKNHYPGGNWKKSDTLPASKNDQCNECKTK